MSARSGSNTGHIANGETIVETSPEFANIEMKNVTDSEALHTESVNVVESETNGEANPPENKSLELEEIDDEVNVAWTVLDLLFCIFKFLK